MQINVIVSDVTLPFVVVNCESIPTSIRFSLLIALSGPIGFITANELRNCCISVLSAIKSLNVAVFGKWKFVECNLYIICVVSNPQRPLIFALNSVRVKNGAQMLLNFIGHAVIKENKTK